MTKPLVSIIIPTFNHAAYLDKALDSVISQTYDHLEIIVVDNYSDDHTEDIVRNKHDQRITYLKFNNLGVIAAARNHGIKRAKGKYVAFLDSDDMWFKEKLQWQIDALEAKPKAGISFCLFEARSDMKGVTEKILGPKTTSLSDWIYESLIRSNFIVTSSVVVRMDVLKEVDFFNEDRALICSEDFDLWLRILKKYTHAFVFKKGGLYRLHVASQSANHSRLEKALAVIDKHEREGYASKQLARHARASFYFQVGWVSVSENPEQARRHFKSAFKYGFRHPRLMCVTCLGFVLSFIPNVYNYLRKTKIDSALSKQFLNSQNI